MRYYPYDFMASILYYRIFCDAIDQTSDWGVLDARDIPEWALLRLKECELIGKACMVANVEKALAHSGNKMILVESPTGPNHFYDLWIKAKHNPSEVADYYDAWVKKEIGTDEYLEKAHKQKNNYYDLWVTWGCPKMHDFKVAFRNLWVKHDCPNKPEWDRIIDDEARSEKDFAREIMGNWEASI